MSTRDRTGRNAATTGGAGTGGAGASAEEPRMHVVATAGHVDHGKSALVRALTGMEPDRWEEERRRGLTLDLGFVWTRLPAAGAAGTGGASAVRGPGDGTSGTHTSGGPGSVDGGPTDGESGNPHGPEVAFVDVPGHERLVANMLAGVGPVPAVLFVVAADQGWQAQSEEHLAVLDALGVRHGLLVVSRSDLADPEPARAAALERIARTRLGTVESVAASAVTGRGLPEVRAAVGRLVSGLPAPDTVADVRLWVDRAFTVRGRGSVVTGTLAAGTLRTGDRLAVPGPDGTEETVRVRGLQTLQRDRDAVGAVARVAVNVHGAAAGRLARGDALVSPGRWPPTGTADVRLRGDPAGELPRHLTLHVGSAAVPVVVRPVGPDTARLSWDRPLPLRIGDVAALRDPGRHRIAAGITVLDVRPPRLARRGAAAARARELAGMSGVPDGAGELRRRGLVRRTALRAMGVPDPPPAVAGDWAAEPEHWRELRRRLVAAVEEHAARRPTDPGLPLEAARRALDLPERDLVTALAATGGPPLHHRDGRLYGSAARPELPPRARQAVAEISRDLHTAPFRAPDRDRLAALGLDARLQAAAAAAGALLRIADGVLLLPGADLRAARVLSGLDQPFTASDARRALDTTRRVAVPLLEHLDARGLTVRLDGSLRRCPDPDRAAGDAPAP
ncbi:SelB C-terminal domain-containing protein [Streptomyces sp. JJ36]|uniref:SelB domain-containing protein n=1 Tax=Streptomyces sp. JJ36 TaxID=2736645 RepID=UPI001F008FC5|nr:SelB C-terminal domain-containing protein [Streptomyces sp. JJ36]MCF6521939.1 SelB C-terminal domain-containing protein [Streptomyces sp. JJ36]